MKHFTLLLFLLIPTLGQAQIWLENFDGSNMTNAPSIPAACDGSSRDYIGIVCQDGAGCAQEINADFVLNGASGSYFGVRDMDHNGCAGDLNGETLSFTGIDISSCGGANVVYVCFTIAESRNMGDAAGAEWSSSNGREDTWDGSSFLYVTANIDGAGAADVTAFEDFDGSDTRPGTDLNCDGDSEDAGDGEMEITDTFTNYCYELPSFGTSMDLTFIFGGLNTGGEDIAIDDIGVYCTDNTASLPGTLLTACTPFDNSGGGVTFWEEDFDGSNVTNPFTIDPSCSIVDSRDYFGIVCLDGGPCGNDDINADYNYGNASGSFFGARDIDGPCGGTAFGMISASGIDISACTEQVYLCIDVAESNSAAENSSSGAFDSWDGNSSLYIYTTFDGSTELVLAGIQSSDGGNSVPAWDTGCNTGSGEGDVITDAFTTYCFALDPNGASTVDISIEIEGLNTGGEDIALDNISLSCTNNTANLPGTVLAACNISRQALPVELISFRGETLEKGSALLSWETSREANNDYFELEYSVDGISFSALSRIAGVGNSASNNRYSFEHETPRGNLNYYRLKQVDFDGAFNYSEVVVLDGVKSLEKHIVFPNPALNQLSYTGEAVELNVYNAFGKIILRVNQVEATQPIDISSLKSGAYLLEIISPNNEREVKRFIKR